MKGTILFISLVIVLASCVSHNAECTEEIDKIERLEQQISKLRREQALPVELPKPKNINQISEEQLEIMITSDGKYYLGSAPDKYYSIEDLESILIKKMESVSTKRIKIEGDKNTDYDAVLKLISIAKKHSWNPVFMYKNH